MLAAAELQSWQDFTVRDSGGHLDQPPLQSRALWGLNDPFLKKLTAFLLVALLVLSEISWVHVVVP